MKTVAIVLWRLLLAAFLLPAVIANCIFTPTTNTIMYGWQNLCDLTPRRRRRDDIEF